MFTENYIKFYSQLSGKKKKKDNILIEAVLCY